VPKKYPPLTPREVIEILTFRGFVLDRTSGDHRNYVRETRQGEKTVTVDMGIDVFDDELIKSMIRQSGLSYEDFYCSTTTTAKKINRRMR
jgi:predicted RNA binding protein YcfA (HicA-like mRNA interferase family)